MNSATSRFWWLLLIFFACGLPASGAEDPDHEVSYVLSEIQAFPSGSQREPGAERLANVVASYNASQKSAVRIEVIKEIATLLRDESRAVRHYVAKALGEFGARAIVTVPILEEVSREMQNRDDEMLVAPTYPSATQLYVAISKITGRPLCDVYYDLC